MSHKQNIVEIHNDDGTTSLQFNTVVFADHTEELEWFESPTVPPLNTLPDAYIKFLLQVIFDKLKDKMKKKLRNALNGSAEGFELYLESSELFGNDINIAIRHDSTFDKIRNQQSKVVSMTVTANNPELVSIHAFWNIDIDPVKPVQATTI